MRYWALPNLTSTDVNPIDDPHAFVPTIPNDVLVSKTIFRKWCNIPTTQHLFLSPYEGVNAGVRLNLKAENPPWRMHGLIVDYDSKARGDDDASVISTILAGTPALLPTWIIETRSSQRRLVWEFAEPLSIYAPAFLESLIGVLRSELKLPRLLAGLDDAALKNPTTYYEVGAGWTRINPDPLDIDIVRAWFAKAVEVSSKKSSGKTGLPEIPMDRVFERIQTQFPGRWPTNASFDEGCRGPAVWDTTATNPAACVYYRHGVYRYSSDKMFHSYAEIFGKDFTRQWEQDRIGAVCENMYYGGRAGYYRKNPGDGAWMVQPQQDIQLYLNADQGLNGKKPTPRDASEVERALLFLQHAKRIDGAMPFVFDPSTIVTLNGMKFLNTSRIKAMAPAEGADTDAITWGLRFPWLGKWLMSFFEPRTQLVWFLTWLKLYWESARRGKLRRGHAVFLVGDTDIGKTLMNANWLPLIMGGGSEASAFLVQGNQFNKTLLEVAHWHIDDAQAAISHAANRSFTERIKGLIANPQVPYQPKYVDQQLVPWAGRVMVTLNEDPQSLDMIPQLDRSIEDKLLIFKCGGKGRFKFPATSESIENKLRSETPHFLRWLAQWTPPDHITKGQGRFGMKKFINPWIKEAAVMSGFGSDLCGVLEMLWKNDDAFIEAAKSPFGYLVTTAAELCATLATHPTASKILGANTARGVGQRLAQLSTVPNSGIERVPTTSKRHSARYIIHPPPKTPKP